MTGQKNYTLDVQVTVPAGASNRQQAELFHHAAAQVEAMIMQAGVAALAHPSVLPPE